jgi:hypothetical protein
MRVVNAPEIPVRVTVSDPWDFTSDDGSNVFRGATGKALTTNDNGDDFPAFLDLGTTVLTSQGSARFFVATPTAKGAGAAAALLQGEPIDCALVGITDDAAAADPVAAALAWRGGSPAARATLHLADGA